MELTSLVGCPAVSACPVGRPAHPRECHLYHDICAAAWDMSASSSLGARSTDSGSGSTLRRLKLQGRARGRRYWPIRSTPSRPPARRSAEQAAADVATAGGDLTELVEQAHGGRVGRSQFAGGRQASGAKRHGGVQQALHQVVGGVLERRPSAVGNRTEAQTNPSGELLDGQERREGRHERVYPRTIPRKRPPGSRYRTPACVPAWTGRRIIPPG